MVNKQCYEDIHVLSIPGFVWHRIQAPSGGGPRHGHRCAVIGGNKMLSVGGSNEFDGWPGIWTRADPFPNGLGILDLTELKWTNNYNATVGTYDSPDVVKNWYAQGAKVEWSSPELQRMFATAENDTGQFSCISAIAAHLTDSLIGIIENTTKDEPVPATASTPVGAIAGGVVGGVAAIAIVAGALVWYFRRRKQHAPQELEGKTGGSSAPEASTNHVPWKEDWKPNMHAPKVYHEMSINGAALEMDSNGSIPQVSADSRQLHPVELQGSYYR